jgi:hypothetical protein
VKDKYLQHETAGDQVCGRTVAGLNVNSFKFGVSPPFFDTKEDETNAQNDLLIDSALVVVYGDISPVMQRLFRFLLASLLYHLGGNDGVCFDSLSR